MTTESYRDELTGLSDAIASFTSAANYGERALESGRLYRWWNRVAMTSQPKRLPERQKIQADRLLRRAAELLNDWDIETKVIEETQECQA